MTNNKVLLIQFRTDISKEHEVECFLDKLKIPQDSLRVVNAILDNIEEKPEDLLEDIGVIILAGSGQYNLSKNQEPIRKALTKINKLLQHLIDNDFPTLGICFGHQIIAQHLGGKVEPAPNMAETGVFEIFLTSAGKRDKFLGKFGDGFPAQLGHKESVTILPKNATLLASSTRCPVQAFRINQNIYCVQFHPEMGVQDALNRLSLYPEYSKEKDINKIRDKLKETPKAAQLLKSIVNFYINQTPPH